MVAFDIYKAQHVVCVKIMVNYCKLLIDKELYLVYIVKCRGAKWSEVVPVNSSRYSFQIMVHLFLKPYDDV